MVYLGGRNVSIDLLLLCFEGTRCVESDTGSTSLHVTVSSDLGGRESIFGVRELCLGGREAFAIFMLGILYSG